MVSRISAKDIAEFIGITGIVASLIFVGLQLKQSQEIALSDAYQARADASLVIRSLPLESPTLLSALTKTEASSEPELTPEERSALVFFFASQLVYLENVHFQYLNGFLTDEQWRSNVGDLKFLFKEPQMRQMWDDGFGAWRDSFVAEIEEVIRQIDAEMQGPD